MLAKELYLERRKKLIEQLGSGIVVLLGNEYAAKNYPANPYHFRQDSTFLYLIGLKNEGLAAVIDIDAYRTYLFGEDPSMDTIVWTGPTPTVKELAASTGIHNTGNHTDLANLLEKAAAQNRPIHFLPPYRAENGMKLSTLLDIPYKDLASKASTELIKALVNLRSIKQEQEIKEMEKAVNISKTIHETLMRKAKAGIKEAELVGLAQGIANAMEGDLAYPPIITINGQTLHNHAYHHTLESGQMVLADVGAEVSSGYASDITRTFPVDQSFSTQQKEIYAIVLDTLEKSIAAMQPNVLYRDVHRLACENITEGLKALGLMKGDTTEIVASGAHALFFPHGLGHKIGLDVHDMEDYGEDHIGYTAQIQRSPQFGTAYLRFAKALQVGYTLTVEPGIYFIPELITQWKAERKFTQFINYDQLEDFMGFSGIRVEDNVLVTPEGARILGQPIAKTIDEIESLRNA